MHGFPRVRQTLINNRKGPFPPHTHPGVPSVGLGSCTPASPPLLRPAALAEFRLAVSLHVFMLRGWEGGGRWQFQREVRGRQESLAVQRRLPFFLRLLLPSCRPEHWAACRKLPRACSSEARGKEVVQVSNPRGSSSVPF